MGDGLSFCEDRGESGNSQLVARYDTICGNEPEKILDYQLDERLSTLTAQFGIRWTVDRPGTDFAGQRAPGGQVERQREPAEFRIYAGELIIFAIACRSTS